MRSTIAARSAAALVIFAAMLGTAGAQLPANPKENPPTPARPPAGALGNSTTPPEIVAPKASAGVLKPPANVDPGMKVTPPPAAEFPTPVIHPPGETSGGQPTTAPK